MAKQTTAKDMERVFYDWMVVELQNKINIKFTTSTYQSAHTHLEFINKRWWRQQFTDKTQLNTLPIHHADIIIITIVGTYYLLALRSVSESLMNPPALALSLSLFRTHNHLYAWILKAVFMFQF